MQSKNKVSLLRTFSGYFWNHSFFLYFSPNTLHHLHCDTVIFIVLLWSEQRYLLLWREEYISYSFCEERCIFQGGGLASTTLCKSIIKEQSCKLKKLKTDDHFNMKKKSWNCRISLNYGSRVALFRIRISWNKSDQKKRLCFDGKLFRKGWQNFISRIFYHADYMRISPGVAFL